MSTPHTLTTQALTALFDRPIAFHPIFARMTGSIQAGILLSQAFYWASRTSDPEGWFYKTQQDWEEETALNRTQQETARRILKTLRVLYEERRGIPAKLFYRLDYPHLIDLLNAQEDTKARVFDLERMLDIYSPVFLALSKQGLARAQQQQVQTEYVDYAAIYRRDNAMCHICDTRITTGPAKSGMGLQFDHKIPLVKGGPHIASNLFCAHVSCNLIKGGAQSADDGQSSLSMMSMQKIDALEGPSSAIRCAHHQPSSTEITTEITTERRESPSEISGPVVIPLAPVASHPPPKAALRIPKKDWTQRTNWPEKDRWLFDALTAQEILDITDLGLWDQPWWDAISYAAGGLDPDIIEEQFATMKGWCIENPREVPRSTSGWKRFMRSWFQRYYRDRRREQQYGKAIQKRFSGASR